MVLGTGGLSCGKTTTLKSILFVMGSYPLGFYLRSTLAFIFKKCCTQTLPIAWDDPSDSNALQQILIDMFHQAGRGTASTEAYPATIPLISVNDKLLKKDLRNLSRAIIIKFQPIEKIYRGREKVENYTKLNKNPAHLLAS